MFHHNMYIPINKSIATVILAHQCLVVRATQRTVGGALGAAAACRFAPSDFL